MKDTVLIADDERNIREGLKVILDWEELGFTICGDAADGEDTLHKILALDPKLVLIDLNMPGLNGIDVIRRAREEGYEGDFIILTGYSEFTYAQAAIHYGVTDYIVKPVDEDKLQKVVENLHGKLESMRKTSGRMVKMRGKAKNAILRDLCLQENKPEEGGYSKEDLSSIGLNAGMYRVVLYEINRSVREKAENFRLPQLLTAWMENDTFDSFEIDQRGVILLKGRMAVAQFNSFLKLLKNREFEKDSPLDFLFAACGRCTTRIEELPVSYQDALKLSQRRFFCSPDECVVEHEQWEGADESLAWKAHDTLSREKMREYMEALQLAIQKGSKSKVSELMNSLGEYLSHASADIADIRLFVTDLCLQTKENITKAYPDTAQDFESNSAIIDYGYTCFYLYEFLEKIEQTAMRIMGRIKTEGNSEGTIADVLSYIDHHYYLNLTLEEIAPRFGYNHVYFGKLFTRMTGTSFNNYLNARRIEKAKSLLAVPGSKVYDVARRVGYSDVDYFTRRFRKETGMRPAEFKKMSERVEAEEI